MEHICVRQAGRDLTAHGEALKARYHGGQLIVCSMLCTVYKIQCILVYIVEIFSSECTVQCRLSSIVQSVLYKVECIVQCRLYCTMQSVLYNAECIVQCIVYRTVYSVLYSL